MLWLFLAILAAFTVAGHDTAIKKLLDGHVNPQLIAGGMFFVSGLILLSIVFVQGVPTINPTFYGAVLITIVLNILATVLAYRALTISDLSLIAPMASFTPVFLIGTSFLILGERPSALGFAGILLIVLGSYVLHRKSFSISERWSDAIYRLFSDRGSLLILLVAFIFSITSNFDKIAALNASPLFSAAVINTLLGILFLIFARMFGKRNTLVRIHYPFLWFAGLGAVFALGAWASATALTLQIVPYVISVKRLSAVFSVVAGYLILKEKNIRPRLAGALIMVAGVALIAFS